MIKSLRESKATLSALVEKVSQGEEVIITVHGKPKARLCPIKQSPNKETKEIWAQRVKEDWATYTTKVVDSSEEIFDHLREDRI